ncbi:ArsR/SmtB family transcription factor [Thermococcus sp.]
MEKSQSELAESLDLTQATVNHHIKELLKLGVVKSRKEGRNVIYELNCDVDTLQEYRPKIWEKWAEQLVELKGLESTAGIYILDCI